MNSLFFGIHEVRLFRPNGVAVGYFDNWDAALRAIESEPTQYKAAYFTLNPVKLPESIPVNPSCLRSSSNAAGASDIERRVWLLIDLDPPRQAKTNSTAEEKQGAADEAGKVREYLRSRNWPDPVLGDSGNGWHLLYRIDLPNDPATTETIRSVLLRLHQLFPMVDLGNFDPPRLCKLYGSWARKGEHSEERPWRRSAIVEPGSGGLVTEEQLRDFLPPTPKHVATDTGRNVKLERLLGFLDYYGVAWCNEGRDVLGGWQVEIECPWEDEHSDESPRDTVVSFIAGRGYGFKCFHAHCAETQWRDFRAEMEERNPGLAPYFGKLPLMTHSDIARQFIEEHDDFVRLYDQDNATGVWMPGTRWSLDDPGDALLRMSIRQYLDELYSRYPAPEPDKRDYRLELKNARFVSGVLSEVKPWLPPKSVRDFDSVVDLLPLPNGLVADLRRGQVREMRREDCQTRRIKVMPSNMATPRWDRFLREVTNGDDELAAFIVRVCALALTGLSLHVLIFFEGRGRNGKGCLCRLVEHLLMNDVFSVCIKPSDVEFHHGNSDRDKRLMGRLHGRRFCYTGETVSGNLDWTLLKTLSGGDTLAGANLYQDEAGFKPSHTLVLLTNDRPKLPPTAAFKGRLVYVPFRVDFSDRVDLALEDDLKREAPGILYQLIKAAPPIFDRGVEPPACVLEATADLLDENDVARPFIESCLVEDSGAITPLSDIEEAIRKYVGGAVGLAVGGDNPVDRILAGVRAKWDYGRKWVQARQVRGLLGVRLRSTS